MTGDRLRLDRATMLDPIANALPQAQIPTPGQRAAARALAGPRRYPRGFVPLPTSFCSCAFSRAAYFGWSRCQNACRSWIRCRCHVSVWSGRREKPNIGSSPPLRTPQYTSYSSDVRRSWGTSSQMWTSPAGRMSGPAMPWWCIEEISPR
jgi:hypothetical protein